MPSRTVCMIGHFAFGENALNGQTVKTLNLLSAFEKYTDYRVICIDTRGCLKHLFSIFKQVKAAFKECDALIMLPAHNAVRVFAPLLSRLNKKYHKKIYYDVIGGWLPAFLQTHKCVAKALHNFTGIWTETNVMKEMLIKQGYRNVSVVPNFKELSPLPIASLSNTVDEPLALCTFSRVARLKGIGSAVHVVNEINAELGRTALTLDIYGPVAAEEEAWFADLKQSFSDSISYRGAVDSDKSVEILRSYSMLLFPTLAFTEGIPGTIIDAYASGVPVIASRWESFADIIEEGVTGIGYAFGEDADLKEKLLALLEDPTCPGRMKPNCIRRASSYCSADVIQTIVREIERAEER